MDDFFARLDLHVAAARQSRLLRLKQRFSSLRALYLFPLAVSLLPGKLLADHFYPAEENGLQWVMVVYGLALLIAPIMFWWVRRDRAFETQKIYLTAALQKLLQEQGRLQQK